MTLKIQTNTLCTGAIKLYQACICRVKTSLVYFQTNPNWAAVCVKTDVFVYLAHSAAESKTDK